MGEKPILEVLSRAGPAGTWVVEVAGEIDLDNHGVLQEGLAALLDQGHALLAIDVARVSYVDSTGLKVLIEAQAHAKARGGGLVLIAPGPRVTKVIRLVGLEALLPTVGSVAEASSLLTGGAPP